MPLKCVVFYDQCHQKFNSASNFKPGFHIVVSVVSVVRKKFIGRIEFPGGGTPIWNRRGCSSEILNSTPKGDHLGMA